MTKPNFLMIGAPKAGTTTLYNYLKQHPQIYMSPIKEPHFFSFGCDRKPCPVPSLSPVNNLEDYLNLFQKVSGEIAIGEASNSYLSHARAVGRIHQYIPHAKLIAILRDPSEGAYSKYLMTYRRNYDNVSKHKLTDDFTHAVQNLSWIRESGLYHKKLKRYLNLFDREQIKICLFEDLKTDLDSLLRDIFRFLNVDENFCVDKAIAVYNGGGIPKNKIVYTSLNKLRDNFNNAVKPFIPKSVLEHIYGVYVSLRNYNLEQSPPLPLEIRQQLINLFREDIMLLQDLIQRDLSPWLE